MFDSLNQHIAENAPCYVEKAIKPSFDWSDAVALLQYCADEDIGKPIGIMNYMLPAAAEVEGVNLVKAYLNETLDNKLANAQMFVTLSTKDDPSYKNNTAVLLWNVHGLSEFSFGDEEERVVRLMQPGDLVYVPRELPFKMKPLNARVFVSFGIEKLEGTE